MFQEMRIRRAASGAIVLALHILLLLFLLAVLHPPAFERAMGMREVIVRFFPQPEKAQVRQNPFRVPPPLFIQPVTPQAITPPSARPAAPTEPQGDIGAVGRYLTNCSGAEYEKLSPREKEHCLANKWDNKGPLFTLGPAKPSPFDAVIAKRNAPMRSPTKDCGAGVPNVNLGMSCMDFGNSQPQSGSDDH